MEPADLIVEIILVLLVAGLFVPASARLGIPSPLAYLLGGLLIGPYGLLAVAGHLPSMAPDIEAMRLIGDFGIVLLLFTLGLEFSPAAFLQMRRLVFGLGTLQVLATGLLIALIARAFGNDPIPAGLLGACLALSSTAAVMDLLSRRRLVHTVLGRFSFSILLLQDLAVVPLLMIVGAFGGHDDSGPSIAVALVTAAVSIVLILLIGRLVLERFYRFVAAAGSREGFIGSTLLVAALTAAAAQAAGMSMALGAFLAGLLLAESDYRGQLEIDLEPFKGLMLGIFFISVGMSLDLSRLAEAPVLMVASVVGLILLKTSVTGTLSYLFGAPVPIAGRIGLLLAQSGEFAFVVVGLSMAAGLLDPATGQFMLFVTAFTIMLTPLLDWAGSRLEAWLHRPGQAPAGTHRDHAVILGFGRVGKQVAAILDEEAVPWVALDADPAVVAAARSGGRPVLFGRAEHASLHKSAGLADARLVVLTIDHLALAEKVVADLRHRCPDISVLARARDVEAAERLCAIGVDAVPETMAASLQIGALALERFGRRVEPSPHHRRSLEPV